MDFLPALATFVIVQLLALISPGQSFIIVTRQSLANSRINGIATAVGMGVGSVIWAGSVMVGLTFILQEAMWVYTVLKYLGTAYLLYLAFIIWQNSAKVLDLHSEQAMCTPLMKSFSIGLMTQLANPKVMIFFGSIMFTVLPLGFPNWYYILVLIIIFLNEMVWYTLVAVFFSVEATKQAYVRVKHLVDKVMSLTLGAIGLSLAATTFSEQD